MSVTNNLCISTGFCFKSKIVVSSYEMWKFYVMFLILFLWPFLPFFSKCTFLRLWLFLPGTYSMKPFFSVVVLHLQDSCFWWSIFSVAMINEKEPSPCFQVNFFRETNYFFIKPCRLSIQTIPEKTVLNR